MYKVSIPESEHELEHYYQFRWQMLCKPWGYPQGSEKDEYDSISAHRMITNQQGEVIAVGRIHLNANDEAQIRHIAVQADMKGKGLGKLILHALEKIAIDKGVERLVSNSREQSIDFFLACGFEIVQELPEELGQLKRQQMVKYLTAQSSQMLHPEWCDELQNTWYETIPISEHMGIKLHQYTHRSLEVRASLNKNINLHGSMFAGSIYSLATLTGWGMLYLQLKARNLAGHIVLGDGKIHYHKPITSKPRALCYVEHLTGGYDKLSRGRKSHFELQVGILDEDKPVAEFNGVYWILPDIK
jgi:thioesterase domain-containing protein